MSNNMKTIRCPLCRRTYNVFLEICNNNTIVCSECQAMHEGKGILNNSEYLINERECNA